MPKQQDYGDKDPDALADYSGLEQWLPYIWLEHDDEETEGFALDGHIRLFRDFRSSGDPAVLISQTLQHAPKLLEMLDRTAVQLDFFLVKYGHHMTAHPYAQTQQIVAEAAELVNKLKAFTPVDMPEYDYDELGGES